MGRGIFLPSSAEILHIRKLDTEPLFHQATDVQMEQEK